MPLLSQLAGAEVLLEHPAATSPSTRATHHHLMAPPVPERIGSLPERRFGGLSWAPMNGILSAGDRALAVAKRLRPLPPYPPREVPSIALWAGSMRDTPALPLALALSACALV